MASTRGAAAFLKSVVHCPDHMAERGKKNAAHIASNVVSVVSVSSTNSVPKRLGIKEFVFALMRRAAPSARRDPGAPAKPPGA